MEKKLAAISVWVIGMPFLLFLDETILHYVLLATGVFSL